MTVYHDDQNHIHYHSYQIRQTCLLTLYLQIINPQTDTRDYLPQVPCKTSENSVWYVSIFFLK